LPSAVAETKLVGMSRRASSSVHPFWIIGAVALLAVATLGGWALYRSVSDPYRTITPLDVSVYLENANSLRGNVYKVTASVNTQLAWAPREGRLYSVEVEGRSDILPLMIPASFNSINVQKGQRYFFKIEVGEKGILRVEDIRKV
jgi:hypothetical protein